MDITPLASQQIGIDPSAIDPGQQSRREGQPVALVGQGQRFQPAQRQCPGQIVAAVKHPDLLDQPFLQPLRRRTLFVGDGRGPASRRQNIWQSETVLAVRQVQAGQLISARFAGQRCAVVVVGLYGVGHRVFAVGDVDGRLPGAVFLRQSLVRLAAAIANGRLLQDIAEGVDRQCQGVGDARVFRPAFIVITEGFAGMGEEHGMAVAALPLQHLDGEVLLGDGVGMPRPVRAVLGIHFLA